jgi:regulatory protein
VEERSPLARKALEKLQAWCARSERCERDVRRRLEGKDLSDKEIAWIVESLNRGGFVDEHRYTKSFVHDALKLKGWGVRRIRYVLKMKGISDAVMSAVLMEQEDPEAESEKIIRAEMERLSVLPERYSKEEQRLVSRFLRKGHHPELILRVLQSIRNAH